MAKTAKLAIDNYVVRLHNNYNRTVVNGAKKQRTLSGPSLVNGGNKSV
jgi:hypothetical protein